jgi:CRP-like cAMP-binding protein
MVGITPDAGYCSQNRIPMPKPEALIQFLESSKLVNHTKAEEIAGHFKELNIPKNEFFLKEDKISNDYLFMEQGFMRAFATNTLGEEVTTAFYSDGHVVFEVDSFFNRTPSKENIQALTDCNGWGITYEQLNSLFHNLPEFREFGRNILVKGFAALKSRTLGMITDKADLRYAKLLQQNPEILQHAALKQIATYLGVTDTSLSRIRKEFAKKQKGLS